jgi:biopolymer transport protein ExbD
LSERLKALGEKASEETAMISADQATPHGVVVKLMDSLRTAGLVRFALNVETNTAPTSPATKH